MLVTATVVQGAKAQCSATAKTWGLAMYRTLEVPPNPEQAAGKGEN